MTEDVCETCGARNPVGSQFCTSCGAYLGWDGASRPAPEPAPSPPAQPAAPATAPQPSGPGPTPGPPPGLPPDVTATTQAVAVMAGAHCPSCGTENPPERRFCRKCGFTLPRPAPGPAEPSGGARVPWWRRFGSSSSADRLARSAYRRSLPTRYRLFRGAVVLLVVALVAGALYIAGRSPMTWLRHRIDDIRGTLVAADVSPPTGAPKCLVLGNPPKNAVDLTAAAWTTKCGSRFPITSPNCDTLNPPDLKLTPLHPIELRALQIRAGVPGDPTARLKQYRPMTLELRFSDNTCQRVSLRDTPDPQLVPVTPKTIQWVTVAVAGTFPPDPPQPGFRTSITELQLLTRPS